jgi:Protein of unknown function (DUF4197)
MRTIHDKDRRAILAGLTAMGMSGAAQAQDVAKALEEMARAAITKGTTSPQPSPAAQVPSTTSTTTTPTVSNVLRGLPGGVTNQEADSGLRQALTNGAIAAVLRLGKLDGYWADNRVKIPLPNPLDSLQRRLTPLRLSGSLDDLQLKINRAAELAAPAARTIFSDAVRTLTVEDVVGVLRGGETAGTDLLKTKTRPQLVTLFNPPVTTALTQSGAGRGFDRVVSRYGPEIQRLGGLVNLGGANADLKPGASLKDQFVSYSVGKALDGLFYYVAEEERLIRKDPLKRTTDLLKRVFGSL